MIEITSGSLLPIDTTRPKTGSGIYHEGGLAYSESGTFDFREVRTPNPTKLTNEQTGRLQKFLGVSNHHK